MALDWLDLSLASLRRDENAAQRFAEELYELRPRLNPANEGLHIFGIHLVSHMWDEQIGEVIEPLTAAMTSTDAGMVEDVLMLALARTGELERLRNELPSSVDHPVPNWSSTTTWCSFAEAAAVVNDVGMAEQLVTRLEPLAGQIAISGISSVMGPVDGYRALALATAGRRDEASEAAEQAARQSDEWGFTAYADWLAAHRARLGI